MFGFDFHESLDSFRTHNIWIESVQIDGSRTRGRFTTFLSGTGIEANAVPGMCILSNEQQGATPLVCGYRKLLLLLLLAL